MSSNLDIRQQIVDEKGYPTLPFHIWWQEFARNQDLSNEELAAQISAITGLDSSITTVLASAENASLVNSGVLSCTLTSSDSGSRATVYVTSHVRAYGDGSTVSVFSGTVLGLDYATTYYICYDQATRVGGSVLYLATTDESQALQVNDRHLIGTITTPAAAAADTAGITVDPPGIGYLPTSGSVSIPLPSVREVSASTSATVSDDYVLADATGGVITVTLPAVSGNVGVVLTVKKLDASGNAVTIDGNASETIDGVTTKSLTTQYQSYTIVCDGVEWWVV